MATTTANGEPRPALADKYRLVRLTREELLVDSKKADHQQWGAPSLDLAQYQTKELLQRQTAFAQRGSMYWALVEKKSGGATGDDDSDLVAGQDVFHCLCKTHRFDCAFRTLTGDIVRGYAFQVGSVFTRPESRKQGLASFFLAQLSHRLKELPGALVSGLYSIIGPEYYARLGWQLYPSTLSTIDAHAAAVAARGDSDNLEKLFLDDALDAVLAAENARLVESIASKEYQGREAFVMLPTRDSAEWQFCVGVHFARIRGFDQLPSQCGVRLRDSGAFVVWCHHIKGSTLFITRARFSDESPADTAQLLSAAVEEARKFQLDKVIVWNPPPCLRVAELSSQFGIVHEERKLACSSAVVFVEPSNRSVLPDWVANERFAWV